MPNNFLALGRRVHNLPPFEPRVPWVGADLQTLKNTLHFVPPDLGRFPAARLTLPLRDGTGDCLSAILNEPPGEEGKPLIVLIHGLTGGEASRNIQESASYHLQRGFPVLRLNLRNAGPSLGKCHHFYHAGRSADVRDAIAALPPILASKKKFLIGVSLGGNLLLKYLAERAELESVIGAATVCAPIDLKAAQQRLASPRNWLYQKHLLKCLVQDTSRVAGLSDHAALADLNTIYEFDDRVVAPFCGFDGADDYYARSSAAPLLPHIEKPALLVMSDNDPWIPLSSYLRHTWPEDGPLSVVATAGGGHVGFHGKGSTMPWHNRAIGVFIDSLL